MWNEPEPLDGFEVGETGVGFADHFAIQCDYAAIGNEGFAVGNLDAGVFRPAFESGEVR